MANTFAPFGFRSFGRAEGAAPTAGLTRFPLVSSDTNTYFTGDPVAVSSASIASSLGPAIILAGTSTNANEIVGIFAGCEFYNPSVGKTVWSAYFPGNVGSSATGFAYVITDPEQLYIAQGTTVAVFGSSMNGLNIGFTSSLQSAGNTTNGISNVALASSSVTANSSLPFKVIDAYANWAPPGTNGTSTGSEGAQIMVVKFNNFYRLAGTTGPST